MGIEASGKNLKRIDELDVLKGIAILLMILDHSFGWGPEVYLHKIIQSFHMPLFFIVGGTYGKLMMLDITSTAKLKRY